MRIPFISRFRHSPFEDLQEHAEVVKECGWLFQQAMECHGSQTSKRFKEYRDEVDKLESRADAIKRRIRGHIPQNAIMPVSQFQLFMYLKEQDKVLDSVEDSLNWLSLRINPGFPEGMKKDFDDLVHAVVEPIEQLSRMVAEASKYFESYSDKQRNIVKEIIRNLRKQEHDIDKMEDALNMKIFNLEKDPVSIFHLVKLTEIVSSIADHAENAGDMMRAMIARRSK